MNVVFLFTQIMSSQTKSVIIVDSTYAKNNFDVNLHANQEQAQIALDIMSDCCKNDKRKSIHFANLAKCCLAYYDTYGAKE